MQKPPFLDTRQLKGLQMKTDIVDWRTNRLKKDKLKGRQRILATAMGRYKGR